MAQMENRFPDVSAGDRGVLKRFDFYRDNVILDVTATRAEFAPHSAPLSLKAMIEGEEVYCFGGARLPIAPGRFLVLNSRQEYASHIDSHRPVRSFCIFFSDAHAASVADAAQRGEERRLDLPDTPLVSTALLRPGVRPDEGALSRAVARLRAAVNADRWNSLLVDELCLEILHHLCAADRGLSLRAARIDCLRKPVRMEILRRLERVVDHVLCHLDRRLTIDGLAGIACMAPYHFIRRFSEAYGCTPHRFVTDARMAAACRMLAASDASIRDVALDAGYRSPTAFGREFRRRTGLTPTAYRAARRG